MFKAMVTGVLLAATAAVLPASVSVAQAQDMEHHMMRRHMEHRMMRHERHREMRHERHREMHRMMRHERHREMRHRMMRDGM